MASAFPRRLRAGTAGRTSRCCAFRLGHSPSPSSAILPCSVPAISCSHWGVSTRVARAAFGAVSATGGKWRAWKGGEIDRWLQSDLTIYPGFGGGPLVDSGGQIHGINSGALSRPLATTIPVGTVNRVVAQLLERGYVPRGWIGAAMQPVRTDEGGGLLLVSIEKDSPAATAGLLLGDVIVTSFDQLLDVLGDDSVGKKVSLDVVRAGKQRKIEVVIGERPRGRGRAGR